MQGLFGSWGLKQPLRAIVTSASFIGAAIRPENAIQILLIGILFNIYYLGRSNV